MTIPYDSVTIWRKDPKAGPENFKRTVYTGVHVEETEQVQLSGSVAPLPAWSIRVFLFHTADVECGDFIARGIHTSELPVSTAHEVVSIKNFSTARCLSHIEVSG